VVDHVARVLLQRVVHRRIEVRLRSVVVDSQPAADVEVLDRRPERAQLDEGARRLAQRVLDGADVGHLAADVVVQQLEPTELAVGLEPLDQLDDLRRGTTPGCSWP
jgi:hypothetical protein